MTKINIRIALFLFCTALVLAVLCVSCEASNSALSEAEARGEKTVVDNNESALTYIRFSGGKEDEKNLSWSETFEEEEKDNLENYVWYYTAEKVDSSTEKVGETTEQTKVGSTGSLSEEIGPFSLGYWTFTLYGYSEDRVLTYIGTIEKVALTKQKDTLIQFLPLELESQIREEDPTGIIIVSSDITYYSSEKTFYADTVVLKDTANGTEEVFSLERGKDLVLDNLPVGLYILAVQDRGVEQGTEFTYAEGKLALRVKETGVIRVTGTIDELLGYVQFIVTVKED